MGWITFYVLNNIKFIKLSWQYSMSRFGTTLCLSLVYLKFQFQGHVLGLCWANARINNFCNKAWWLFRSSQFWFRIVNMCKTLSQIKRLGKYFQRWSERKDFAQVSTRPRNWERKIKNIENIFKTVWTRRRQAQAEMSAPSRRRTCRLDQSAISALKTLK